MRTDYLKRSLIVAGATVAFAAVASAGNWVDVTHKYIKDAAYIPGWQGVVTGCAEGVGEVWNGAFRLYRVIPDAPAGSYTLTCNAFYRCGNNDYSLKNMKGNAALYTAYIFAGNDKKTVVGLVDELKERPQEGETYDPQKHFPNGLWDANESFKAGKYVNTLTTEHKGGDLVIGIANTGSYDDEWCAFDNFKLVGPNGEVALENGDFSTGLDSKREWDNFNSENKEKTPDMQKDGAGGGDYRKCGGSPYKYGQQIELPAGKYRFGMLTFHRYGSTVSPEGKYFNHKSGDEADAYGRVNRTPKDWYDANDYEAQTTYDHAYIFMSQNEACPKDLNWSEDFGELTEGKDARTRIKDCWEICKGNFDEMPDNNTYGKEATRDYETRNKVINWHDSGNEREAAAAFVNEPEKYYQYVEFELTEPTKVWVGMGKNTNTSDGYWQAWADQTLKVWDENAGAGVSDLVVEDENAPVEYYNLQGIRVANPENGIYIVKQGNKVTKRIIK